MTIVDRHWSASRGIFDQCLNFDRYWSALIGIGQWSREPDYVRIQNFIFIPWVQSYLEPCKLGCTSLHLNQVTKLPICPIELHRVKINPKKIWRNRKISRPPLQTRSSDPRYTIWISRLSQIVFALILNLWSSIWQMGSFVTWFRCNLGHPNASLLVFWLGNLYWYCLRL